MNSFFKYISSIVLLYVGMQAHAQILPPFGWQHTHDDIHYKYFVKDTTLPMPKDGDYIRMSLQKIEPSGLEVFNTDFFGDPYGVEVQLNTTNAESDVMHFFLTMHVHDSAIIYIPAYKIDTHKTWNQNHFYKYILVLHDVIPQEIYFANKLLQAQQQMKVDSTTISQYLHSHRIRKHIKDSSGVVVIKRGNKRKRYNTVREELCVHYKGFVLDGILFDNSYEREEPYCFKRFNKEAIIGWDIGLSYFKVGQRGAIIIPSGLGYGTAGSGNDIPPNAILYFEVEVVKK